MWPDVRGLCFQTKLTWVSFTEVLLELGWIFKIIGLSFTRAILQSGCLSSFMFNVYRPQLNSFETKENISQQSSVCTGMPTLEGEPGNPEQNPFLVVSWVGLLGLLLTACHELSASDNGHFFFTAREAARLRSGWQPRQVPVKPAPHSTFCSVWGKKGYPSPPLPLRRPWMLQIRTPALWLNITVIISEKSYLRI